MCKRSSCSLHSGVIRNRLSHTERPQEAERRGISTPQRRTRPGTLRSALRESSNRAVNYGGIPLNICKYGRESLSWVGFKYTYIYSMLNLSVVSLLFTHHSSASVHLRCSYALLKWSRFFTLKVKIKTHKNVSLRCCCIIHISLCTFPGQ